MLRNLSMLFCSGFLVSCAVSTTKTPIDEKSVSQIKTCKTTKSDLVSTFGEPESSGFQSEFNMYTWIYRPFVSGPGDTKRLVAFVNKDEKVIEYSMNPNNKKVEMVTVVDTWIKESRVSKNTRRIGFD